MKNLILSSAFAALSAVAFAAPVMADEVIIQQHHHRGYYDHSDSRPAITIDKHGVRLNQVRDDNGGNCVTKTITTENDYGDRTTKRIRTCD